MTFEFERNLTISTLVQRARRVADKIDSGIHIHGHDFMTLAVLLEGVLKVLTDEQLDDVERHLKGLE